MLTQGLAPPASVPLAKEEADEPPKGSRYESRETARLLMLETKNPEALNPEQCGWLEEVRRRCPKLAEVQELAGRFATILREGKEGALGSWLEEAENSPLPELRTFSRGIRQDEAAVRASTRLLYSNGQVEGQINRLKLVKRSMYGRASFGLLRQRVLRSV